MSVGSIKHIDIEFRLLTGSFSLLTYIYITIIKPFRYFSDCCQNI